MVQKIAFCHTFVKQRLRQHQLKVHTMKYVNFASKTADFKIDINEFRLVYRKAHQLAAMMNRTEKEDLLFYASLKRSTELLHFIRPGQDAQVDKMLDFAFKFRITKQEEAMEGDEQAKKILTELAPLYRAGLVASVHLN